ncbi:MAG: DUF2892 domain-containing protein [Zoogloeaceae bacterium]|jgi:hypothetical protein|nr:DUF2892 domain-containing protein [Zoogloeaceae bacterium]
MKKNVGGIDRVLRIVMGLVLIALAMTDRMGITATIGDWGWLGVLPLVTGLIRFCTLYPLLKISTCPLAKNN